MGACSTATTETTKEKGTRYDEEPADTASLKKVTLPTLLFSVLLSDIKIKKCTHEFIGVRFKIEEVAQEECPVKEVDKQQKAYWKINRVFEFMMNEFQLRRKFLEVSALGNKKEVLATLRINLYTIWTGPYHLDFSLPLKNSTNCRVSFNLKISQGIHFKLQNTLTEMLPVTPKREGQCFTFTLQAILGQKAEPSNYAAPLTLSDPKQTKSLRWESPPNELPAFNQKIAYYEIYSSSLHLTFWRTEPGLTDPLSLRYESQGECFIGLSKLMTLNYTYSKDEVTNISYMNRTVQLTQKVWLHGQEVGTARFKFDFALQAYQKQMQSCVRTEEGVLASTPVFVTAGTDAKECEEIVALTKLNVDIQKEFIALDQQIQTKKNFISIKEILLRIYNALEKELALLQKTYKESTLFYKYRNDAELRQAQRFIIDFAFKMLTYIHEDLAVLHEICWTILTCILQRGEFKLTHLAFSKEEKEVIKKNAPSASTQAKIEVGIKYTDLLHELLKETLRSLQIKGDAAEQIFAESFCAYAYFRIPSFREEILGLVREANDPEVPEWRGSENSLYVQSSHDIGVGDDFYANLFDWQGNFLQPLSNSPKYKQHVEKTHLALMEGKWKLRLSKRSGAFFTCLEKLVAEIEYVCVVSKHIKWHYLPGYNRLLQAFLVQMKNAKIKNYSPRLKKCCVQLLSNEKLLNVFVVILLKNANVHDPQTVSVSFDLIDQFFKSIKRNARPIPGTFDYKYLLRGIKMVLNSELEFSISQVLLLIYNNFAIFSLQFSLQVSLYIMTNLFYKFFFHWSYNLRHIFHNFLYFRIVRFELARQQESPNHTHNTQSNYILGLKLALSQYRELVLEQIKNEIEPNATNFNSDHYYEKDLFKKMRSKLKSKRNGTAKYRRVKQDQVPQFLIGSKSVDTSSRFVVPKKLLYFQQQQMQPQPIRNDSMGYVKLALQQYSDMSAEMKKKQVHDPTYSPEMTIKKMLDEVELKPTTAEEW